METEDEIDDSTNEMETEDERIDREAADKSTDETEAVDKFSDEREGKSVDAAVGSKQAGAQGWHQFPPVGLYQSLYPLHAACLQESVKLVRRCLDPNVRDCSGETALHVLCQSSSEDLDLLKLLVSALQAGIDRVRDSFNRTPLHSACVTRNLSFVEFLLDRNLDPLECDDGGITPLHLACDATLGPPDDGVIGLLCDKIASTGLEDASSDLEDASSDSENPSSLKIYNCTKSLFCSDLHHLAQKHLLPLLQNCSLVLQKITTEKATRIALCLYEVWPDLLHYAVCTTDLDVLKFFVEEIKCDVNARDSQGDSPLHLACEYSDLELVHFLCRVSDRNLQNQRKQTPLHVALKKKFESGVKCLIKSGHKGDITDCAGNSALHLACKNGLLVSVKHLLVILPNEITVYEKNKQQRDCFNLASISGHIHVFEHLAMFCTKHSEKKTRSIRRSLLYACHFGQTNTARFLVEFISRFSKNASLECGISALEIALSKNHEDIAIVLIQTILQDATCSQDYCKLLLGASKAGKLTTVKFFLDNDLCDCSVTNSSGQSLLHLASLSGNVECVRYLVEAKRMSVTCTDPQRNTPLHLASVAGREDVVKFICSYPLSKARTRRSRDIRKQCSDLLNAQNNECATPLHLSVLKKHLSVAKILLGHEDCKIDIQDKDGNTPLHHACRNRDEDCMSLLLQKKADKTIKNENGATATELLPAAGEFLTV